MQGFIVRKIALKGFGFIQAGTPELPGVEEWFFHKKDCEGVNPFNALRENDCVTFEEYSPRPEKGPRAGKVRLA